MRVALGILNKEIERLQVEIDFLGDGQSNPPKLLRLKAEIEELLDAWQVLKDWKRPVTYLDTLRERVKENNAKYDHCRCVSSDPKDVTLCDRCPDKDEDKNMLDRMKSAVTEEEWAVHLMNNPKDTQAEYEKQSRVMEVNAHLNPEQW